MKKVGTITAALGFIYLGVWLIFKNSDASISNYLFNWWPIIIIILGVEIIFYYGRPHNKDSIGFNGLVIIVVLVFIVINTAQFANDKFGTNIKWLGYNLNISEGIDFLAGINDNNYKIINSNITLESTVQNINFDISNVDIKVKKSNDNKIKIDTNIYVNKNSDVNKYDIKADKQPDGYFINMKESYIKKSQIYLYIPEGYSLKIESNNLKIKSENVLSNINYVIRANNGDVELDGGKSVDLNINNGSVKVFNIETINVKSNNGSFNFEGNCENIALNVGNGSLNINNKITRNIDVNMNLGVIKYFTEDKNVALDISMSHGALNINGIKKVNSSMSLVTGTGEGKAKFHIDNGTVTVENQ